MTNENYSKAYKEVLEILKYVPKEDVQKIPKNKMEMFQKNQDKTYLFSVDKSIPFEEIPLMKETELIFANLFRDYWATPYQRQKIEEKEQKDIELLEQEKRTKYNSSSLFIKTDNPYKQSAKKISNLPIEAEDKKIFQKLIDFFTNKFKIIRRNI